MAKRWMLAALLACGLAQAPAQAQWGFNGEMADPRYDPNVAGNAAAEAAVDMPSLELNVDYLMWWLRDPRFGAPIGAGVAGGPVLAQNGLDYDDPFSGARLAARFWCDNTQTGSLEIAGLIVGENSVTSLQTVGTTSLLVSSTSKMWGAEGNLIVDTLYCGLELIAGYRMLDLQERVDIADVVAPAVINPDRFATRNQFYGGQVGARASYRFGPLTVGAQAKLALGHNHQSADLSGFVTSAAGVTTVGGRYTGAGNIGRTTKGVFSVLPEAEARLGLEVGNGVILYAGYNVLFLTNALRPGDQIVGPPNSAVPVPFIDTHMWAQGLNFGLEVRY